MFFDELAQYLKQHHPDKTIARDLLPQLNAITVEALCCVKDVNHVLLLLVVARVFHVDAAV